MWQLRFSLHIRLARPITCAPSIGLPHEIAHGSLRLTLSEKTTLEDIDYTVDKLKEIIARLRSMSPLYEDFVKKNGKSEA